MTVWAEWLRQRLHAPVRVVKMEAGGGDAWFPTDLELRAILDRRITPLMAGCTYDGAYTWFSPWEARSRRVVRLVLIKGAEACFQWGRCYDFLPVLSGNLKTVSYQRTDKNVGLQLFMESPWTGTRMFQRSGKDLRDVEETILTAFKAAQPAWEAWFRNTDGLEAALREAERQSGDPGSCVWPRPMHVRAFLLAALGRTGEARQALEASFEECPDIPESTREVLRKKLAGISGEE